MHVYYLLCIHCKPIYNYNSILDVDTSAYLFDITFLTLSILMFFRWIIVKIKVYIAVYSSLTDHFQYLRFTTIFLEIF